MVAVGTAGCGAEAGAQAQLTPQRIVVGCGRVIRSGKKGYEGREQSVEEVESAIVQEHEGP